jgi:hypothetical protein
MLKQTSLIVAASVLLAVAPASAQTSTDGERSTCEVFVQGSDSRDQFVGGYVNTCAAADLARQNTIYVPGVLQRMLARSFGFGSTQVEPTGLSGIVAGDAEQRLAPSEFVIAPTADVSAVAVPSARWNAWVDGRYLYTDYAEDVGDLDGPTFTGLAGIDYKITSKFSLGLLVSGESSDFDGPLTDLKSSTIGIGPYVGLVLTDNIVFSANLLGSRIDSEQADGLLQFDTNRVQASAGLNGYWYKGTWRLTPGVTFAWSKEWEEESSGLFADRTIETGVLTPSFQVGNTLTLSDKATMEPWLGAAFDWTLINSVETSGFGTDSETATDLRLQAGFNFGFGSNAQLALTGEASGLLNDDLDSYSIEANFAMQF